MNMHKRPSQDRYFLEIAKLTATRSNCYRRQVGCVLVDGQNRILSTGYNGVPRNYPHCKIGECPRDKPGSDLGKCLAIHAEINAILQCKDIDRICTAYITDSPCLPCTVALANTNCVRIVYCNEYPGMEKSRKVWKDLGKLWSRYTWRITDL